MAKALVIVESPAKAKTINKYLGKEYIVKSSVGHIRDLPVSGGQRKPVSAEARADAAQLRKLTAEEREWRKKKRAQEQLFERMGVDPENGWQAHYAVLPGKEKVVQELRTLAQKVETVYLATDLDREGEAIAWHLQQSIGEDASRYLRVTFNEITKSSIRDAFKNPGTLNMDRVNAQQARRFLDRVVGYMVSPLLWAKIARGLSAGRVQSVAVRLIVERERAIRKFVPEEYWEMHADLATASGEPVRLLVEKKDGNKFRPTSAEQADQATQLLKKAEYRVVSCEAKPVSSHPPAPFITSTLQQAASTRLGFSVKKTMTMAQRLYEAGYITYMRTDSTNLSGEAVAAVRQYIEEQYGDSYLPPKANTYSSKAGAQEAHEAIRPSDVQVKAEELKGVDRDAVRLYELIWRQFVACQMVPAQYLGTTLVVAAAAFELRGRGRVLTFAGFTRVLAPVVRKGDDAQLPAIKQDSLLSLNRLDPRQLFTKPPARFSEAALVRELEKRGIGRPSTYASIISTIQERGYVSLKARRFYAEKMGDIVTDRLTECFCDLLDYGFTARMEETLDDVANGQFEWKGVLDNFYKEFKDQVEQAARTEGGMRANEPVATDIECGDCGRPMQIRTAGTGVFLGCSGYSLSPAERCKKTRNLVPGDEVINTEDDEAEVNALRAMRRCPLCATAMDSYLLDEQHKIHLCGNSPDCSGHEIEQGQFKLKGYDGPVLECDKCGAEMQLKTGRFGKYFGCMGEGCSNTRKLLKSGQAAPPKMEPVPMPELACRKVEDHYVLRDGATGLFLAASQFPRKRETRAPQVSELQPHKSELDPKYHYLLSAPAHDPDGHPAIIRYSRKSGQQYVMSEVAGKATGWQSHFVGGQWQSKKRGK